MEKKEKPKPKPKEKLTEKEIKELMGINRDTYKRHNGAWKRS